MLFLQILTGSKGGSLGSKTEEEEVGGEAAATGIFVHSLAGAACVDMAAEKHTDQRNHSYSFSSTSLPNDIEFRNDVMHL